MKKIFFLFFISIPLFSDTLKDITNYALKHSTVIKQTKADFTLSELNQKESKSKQFGELDAVGSYTHYNIERTLAPLPPSAMMSGTPITTSKNIYSAGVNYTVPLFTGFAMTRDVEINSLAKQMQKAKLHLTKEELVYNIRSLYLTTLTLQNILKAQNAYIKALNKLKNEIAYKIQLGKKAPIDLIKAEADLEEAISQKETLKANIEITKATLSSLVGKKIKKISPIKVRVSKRYYSIDALYDRVLTSSKVKMEDLSVKKADKMIQKSKASLYPQLNLNAYYGRNYGKDIKTGNDDSEELYQVGLNAKYDLIDFGKSSTNIQKAKLAKLKAKLKREQTLLDLKKLIVKAVSNIKSNYATYKSNKQRYKLSKKSSQIEEVRYNSDASTLNDLLLAKSKAVLAKAKMIESLYNYKKSQYFLDYVLEKGVKSE